MDTELKIGRRQSHLNKKDLVTRLLYIALAIFTSGLLVKQQNKNRELHNVTIMPDVPRVKQ